VANLEAKRDAKLNAFGVQRVVVPIIRRQIPEPWKNAERTKTKLAHAASQFPDGVHRAQQVDGGDTHEAVRMGAHDVSDLIVREECGFRRIVIAKIGAS
jgi:hypothetical protein